MHQEILELNGGELKSELEKAGIETDYCFIVVYAYIAAESEDGEELRPFMIPTNFTLREPVFYPQNDDINVLLGNTLSYSTAEDAVECCASCSRYPNPNGESVMVTLKGIEIDETSESGKVWEKEIAGDKIILKAVGEGESVLRLKTESEELGEQDFLLNTKVVSERYLTMVDGVKSTEDLQARYLYFEPGETRKLDTKIIREFYDKETNKTAEEELSPDVYTLKYICYENSAIAAEEDGTVVVSESALQGDGTELDCIFTMSNEEGQEREYASIWWIQICEHEYSTTETVDAGCTEDGYVIKTCSKCKKSKEEIIPKTGHSYVESDRKEADCTNDGYVKEKCSVCKEERITETFPKTGHSFSAWKTTTEPTALKKGVQTRTCKICNEKETKPVSKLKATITLNTKSITLKVKQSTTAVKVTTAKGDIVKSWKSSNTKVVSVNSKGKITAKKAGNATITVTLKSGKKGTVKVKVQKSTVTTSKLTVTGKTTKLKSNKLTLKKGKKETLVAVVTPITSQQKVTFKSSDKKIAAVTSTGKITAKKAGKAKITVQSGKKKVVITVTVKK